MPPPREEDGCRYSTTLAFLFFRVQTPTTLLNSWIKRKTRKKGHTTSNSAGPMALAAGTGWLLWFTSHCHSAGGSWQVSHWHHSGASTFSRHPWWRNGLWDSLSARKQAAASHCLLWICRERPEQQQQKKANFWGRLEANRSRPETAANSCCWSSDPSSTATNSMLNMRKL